MGNNPWKDIKGRQLLLLHIIWELGGNVYSEKVHNWKIEQEYVPGEELSKPPIPREKGRPGNKPHMIALSSVAADYKKNGVLEKSSKSHWVLTPKGKDAHSSLIEQLREMNGVAQLSEEDFSKQFYFTREFYSCVMNIPHTYPGETLGDPPLKHTEGRQIQVIVNKYERDPKARKVCIEHYRTKWNGSIKCIVCEFDFSEAYGEEFEGLIHVHHLNPLFKDSGEHEVDPIKDLVPVCPNCHMALHKRDPLYPPEDLRKKIALAYLHSK